ncbi:hypothetical protein TR51_32200 [Kitasatospora griseola]|uniref:Uncharacterized protein n=1 Tax=Kitasatospora griseola TaxID=2064 RepID=A0A0D0NVV0_KITGR|nr:hypothetical protein TR51_32200 [Kitasatospora griseola]
MNAAATARQATANTPGRRRTACRKRWRPRAVPRIGGKSGTSRRGGTSAAGSGGSTKAVMAAGPSWGAATPVEAAAAILRPPVRPRPRISAACGKPRPVENRRHPQG